MNAPRIKFRLSTALIGIAALMLPGALALGGALTGPQTFTVQVGGEAGFTQGEMGQVPTWELMNFYPSNLIVNVGDTINWKLKSMEFHNVTVIPAGAQLDSFVIPEGGTSTRLIFNPAIVNPGGGSNLDAASRPNSGLLDMTNPHAPKEYSLKATTPGDYLIVCQIHAANTPGGPQGMISHVKVNPAGTRYIRTPDEVAALGASQLALDAVTTKLYNRDAQRASAMTANGNGSNTYGVNIGFPGVAFADWMRFGPSKLTVKVGDSVTFTNIAPHTPHTVSFLSGAKDLDVAIVEPQPAGPPKVVFNPAVLMPSGGTTYAGTGILTSGVLTGAAEPGPHTVTYTFSTPGTFQFICILHDQMGMTGTITVEPKAMASTPAG